MREKRKSEIQAQNNNKVILLMHVHLQHKPVDANQVENASEVLALAEARQALALRERCIEFMLKNLGRVQATLAWASLPEMLRAEIVQVHRAHG